MTEDEVNINFRGTSKYREKLQRAALDRGIKVQGLLERAVDEYLSTDRRLSLDLAEGNVLSHANGDILPRSGAEVTGLEGEFLSECLAVYRSTFGNALRENVKWFRVGMDAVAKLEALERAGERGDNHPTGSAGAFEQGISARLDHQENEADLLKKAALDAGKQLPGDSAADPKTPRRSEPGQQRNARKAGGGR